MEMKVKKIHSFSLVMTGCVMLWKLFLKKIEGRHHVPQSGAYVVAGNHSSLIDGPILCSSLSWMIRRPMHIISVSFAFENWFTSWVMRSGRVIPLERGDPKGQEYTMRCALGFLRQGRPVGIFPEGKLNSGRKLRRFRPGMALLALESGAPVLPVGIRGSSGVIPPTGGMPKFGRRISMHIGAPLHFPEESARYREADFEERGELIKTVLEKTDRAIADLSGLQSSIRR